MNKSILKNLWFTSLLLTLLLLGNTLVFAQTSVQSTVTPPTVSFTSPANYATGVTLGGKLSATFSTAMMPSTINSANFILAGPFSNVLGIVAYDVKSHIATFTPDSLLPAKSGFKATISRAVADSLGHQMLADFQWTFTTGVALDTTPPTVTSTNPTNKALGVPRDKNITATFNEAMDPMTITAPATFKLEGPGTSTVAGRVSYSGTTAIFAPTSALAASTLFHATISIAARDLSSNPLASNFIWTFTTGTGVDYTRPTVTSTNPTLSTTGVCINHAVNATFSKAMNPLTISTATFTVKNPLAVPVSGTVSYDAVTHIATFTALKNIVANTIYTATITTGAKDLAGNALSSNYVWHFTTGASTCQMPLNLRSAANFAIIAAAGVTSIPLTTINGNIALSPTFTITGGPIVNGTTYGGPNPIAVQAQHDNMLAYNAAAGLPNGVIISTGELGGLTLAPGLYKSGISSFAITSSNLTLDAHGDSKAVFIFQMPSSTLTVLGSRSVILSGGAKATNVFWQVGSSATLGTYCRVKGTILALASVTLDTGAVLEGRAFAQTAAVTLDANTVSVPAP